MVDLTNIGTLFAFVLVCIGIIILRFKDPDRERPFRVPLRHVAPPGARHRVLHLPDEVPAAGVVVAVHRLAVVGMSSTSPTATTTASWARAAGPPTPPGLNLAGLGFLLAAVGLFMIPHDAGLPTLVGEAMSGAATDHLRSIGLGLIVLGLIAGVIGVAGARRAETR